MEILSILGLGWEISHVDSIDISRYKEYDYILTCVDCLPIAQEMYKDAPDDYITVVKDINRCEINAHK